ncbi:MAG: hypothetical protein LKM37_08285 [Bacteroidales bacterium]|jgi:hypothetical protein|nr:hypothetical protein [Bacteroidales bacterium]
MKEQIRNIVFFTVAFAIMLFAGSYVASSTQDAMLYAQDSTGLFSDEGHCANGSVDAAIPPYSSVAEVSATASAASGDARVQREQSSQFSSALRGVIKNLSSRVSENSDIQKDISVQLHSLAKHNPINDYYVYTLKRLRV